MMLLSCDSFPCLQPHLGKCFGNIRGLEIKILPRQPPTVKSITSAEGEVISMPKSVPSHSLSLCLSSNVIWNPLYLVGMSGQGVLLSSGWTVWRLECLTPSKSKASHLLFFIYFYHEDLLFVLYRHLKLGLHDWIGISHDEWVLKHPGQVVLTVVCTIVLWFFLLHYALFFNFFLLNH